MDDEGEDEGQINEDEDGSEDEVGECDEEKTVEEEKLERLRW